jgi:hypothetical protein
LDSVQTGLEAPPLDAEFDEEDIERFSAMPTSRREAVGL